VRGSRGKFRRFRVLFGSIGVIWRPAAGRRDAQYVEGLNMPFSSKAVANYFLELAEAEGKTLDPMKIQKLVYFAHGWHLAITGKPLVDERPEAWTYGPVFPTLYQSFKHYGAGPISQRADNWRFDVDPATGRPTTLRRSTPMLDEAADAAAVQIAKEVIRRVWTVYGSWTALQLSQATHVPNGPWDVTRKENPDRKGTDIDEERIRAFFVAQAQRGRSGQPHA